MCLFHFSTCFEQPSAHHQDSQLYQYIIWYISLCVCVCGRLVCRSESSSLSCISDRHLTKRVYVNGGLLPLTAYKQCCGRHYITNIYMYCNCIMF